MLGALNSNLSNLNPLAAYKKTLDEKKNFFDKLNENFKAQSKETSGDEILDKLYKQLEELYKKLALINQKIEKSKSSEEVTQLLSQAQNINAQILKLMSKILKRLEALMKAAKA